MLRNLRYAALTLAVMVLASCAKQEIEPERPVEPPKPKWTATTCQQTDWYQVGRSEGENGKIDTDIEKIAETCADQGVQIDTNVYFQGLAERAHQYCTPAQGRTMGQQGLGYPTLCQPEIYSEFHYEWYKHLQQHCHAQALIQSVPEACEEIKE
jgi:hypothetical protein